MKLKIMTFNVQHFADFLNNGAIDFDKYAAYISRYAPHIVGLNEVFDGGAPLLEKQCQTVGEKAGYPHHCFAQAIVFDDGRPYGNAMLSRYPFSAVTHPIPDPRPEELNGQYAETRCVLEARYRFEDGSRLTVLCCHFGLNIAEQRNAVDTICRITDRCDTPVVLMGDFNVLPESPILNPIRERFADTAPLLDPEHSLTFPSDKPAIKIDYIFLKGGVRALSVQVCPEVLSDHLPMIAELELEA